MHRNSLLVSVTGSVLAIILTFAAGCGSNGSKATVTPNTPSPTNPSSPSSSAFSVASTMPAAGATQVATNSAIQITFSGAADSTTVNPTTIKVTNPQPVTGSVTYNATTYTATFTPAAAMVDNATYTITVSGVTSAGGTALTAPFTATFTTVTSGGATPPASSNIQFQTTFFNFNNQGGTGQLSINQSGSVSVQMSGATASTTYSLQFCPEYTDGEQQPYSCLTLGNVTTNASGSGSATMQFPQPGSWAGDFQLYAGSTEEYETSMWPPNTSNASSEVYTAALQSEAKVNGKGMNDSQGTVPPAGPLTSGTVTYSKGSITFTLNGATPNTTFTSEETDLVGDSDSYLLYNSQGTSGFNTDASGDVTFTVLQDGDVGDIFVVSPENGNTAGFIGGFSVPAP